MSQAAVEADAGKRTVDPLEDLCRGPRAHIVREKVLRGHYSYQRQYQCLWRRAEAGGNESGSPTLFFRLKMENGIRTFGIIKIAGTMTTPALVLELG